MLRNVAGNPFCCMFQFAVLQYTLQPRYQPPDSADVVVMRKRLRNTENILVCRPDVSMRAQVSARDTRAWTTMLADAGSSSVGKFTPEGKTPACIFIFCAADSGIEPAKLREQLRPFKESERGAQVREFFNLVKFPFESTFEHVPVATKSR
jgi:hypothetical protein